MFVPITLILSQMLRLILIASLLVSAPICTVAQSTFGLRTGLSIPTGDFAYDNIGNPFNGAGGARTGFNIGATYAYKLPNNNLGLFMSADLFYNSLSNDAKDIYEASLRGQNNLNSNLDVSYYRYINIPVILGLRYNYPLTDDISLFGDVGLGANHMRMTDMTIIYRGDEALITFDPATKLAINIQAGIRYNEKYTLGLSYLSLGSYEIDSQATEDGDTQDYETIERSISMITLNVGIWF